MFIEYLNLTQVRMHENNQFLEESTWDCHEPPYFGKVSHKKTIIHLDIPGP
jgi:hypothetical protein